MMVPMPRGKPSKHGSGPFRRKAGGCDYNKASLEDGSDYTAEEIEFMFAMYRFKRERGRMPTWPEVLQVAKSLGYRRSE